MTTSSPPRGGVGVVLRLMRTHLKRELTLEQAQTLWRECRAKLLTSGLRSTVRECESSEDGGLDTLPRGDVMDALAYALVSAPWPLYGDSTEEAEAVFQRIANELDKRRYARIAPATATTTGRIRGTEPAQANVPKSAISGAPE